MNSSKKLNDKDSKFIIGDIVRISKYKNIFAKGCTWNWPVKVLWLKMLKILCRGDILSMILMKKKLLELFKKKNCIIYIKKSLKLKK